MTPERYERIRQLFLEARDRALNEQSTYLAQACEGDAELRADVESLLAEESSGLSFLNSPALGSEFRLIPTLASRAAVDPLASGPAGGAAPGERDAGNEPESIGPYRVLGVLGRGGMGVVYKTEQQNPRRTVALKVMRPGMASTEALRRFGTESQVLGRLQHPGIAQVFEAGTADYGHGPQPFFAMEYIDGQSLLDFAAARKLDTRQKLELFTAICDAVQHAHQKGIIHRDLKPDNILVDAEGQPKILDFGVARATDADIQVTTVQTDVRQLIGTLKYMSPEQVSGDARRLDTRADVYALGVILYELLTGRPPHLLDNLTLPQAIRIIEETEPEPLASVNRAFRGDLNTICAKAMEKDRGRRYPSASELAAEVWRFMGNEPISARPATVMYQLGKFARRNRALVSAIGGMFLALAGGLVGTGLLLARSLRAEKLAGERLTQSEEARSRGERETQKARSTTRFLQDMLGSATPEESQGQELTVRELLDQASAEVAAMTEPEVQAALRYTMGQAYLALSEPGEAREQFEESISLYSDTIGPQAVGTYSAMSGLASALRETGDLDQAQSTYEQAIAGLGEALGPEADERLSAVNNLAILLIRRNQLDRAEDLLEEVLEVRRRTLGAEHPETLRTMHNLLSVMTRRGRLVEAETLMRELVSLRQSQLGPKHPSTLRSINGLAEIVSSQGRYSEAEGLYRSILELNDTVFGPHHAAAVACLNNLAKCLLNQDKGDEAGTVIAEALRRRSADSTQEDPLTQLLMDTHAECLRVQGRIDDAADQLRKLMAVRADLYGPSDPRTLRTLNNLGTMLLDHARYDEARPVLEECVAKSIEQAGPHAFPTLVAQANLAKLLTDIGDLDAACTLSRQTYESAEEHLPADQWHVAFFRNRYGACLAGQGKHEEAEPHLRASHAALRESLGPDHDRTRKARQALVDLYNAWGKPEQAVEYQLSAEVP